MSWEAVRLTKRRCVAIDICVQLPIHDPDGSISDQISTRLMAIIFKDLFDGITSSNSWTLAQAVHRRRRLVNEQESSVPDRTLGRLRSKQKLRHDRKNPDYISDAGKLVGYLYRLHGLHQSKSATSCHTSSQALPHTHNYSKLPKCLQQLFSFQYYSSFVSAILPDLPNRYYSSQPASTTPKTPDYLQIRPYLFQQDSLPRLINNSLIPVAVVPLLTVGKKPVDDDTADGEDEDEDGPQELVADGAAGLEDLDWKLALVHCVLRWWPGYGVAYSTRGCPGLAR